MKNKVDEQDGERVWAILYPKGGWSGKVSLKRGDLRRKLKEMRERGTKLSVDIEHCYYFLAKRLLRVEGISGSPEVRRQWQL